jgi:hypothetical protein
MGSRRTLEPLKHLASSSLCDETRLSAESAFTEKFVKTFAAAAVQIRVSSALKIRS